MPELIEQMYCSQQIVIPPKFPYILKRYAKAAIKTQPYDLLRWSYEYFQALVENRPPPVKLRLEYPVFNTEGGLTRGYLKVIAMQLEGMTEVPITVLRSTWRGSCLDEHELFRILCLCEVFMREDSVPKLNFIAVAGGLLTKSLTQTMILLCETLTKEPEGGSAAIPTDEFLAMYHFLARMDASKDVKYYDGYPEGMRPLEETIMEEEEDLQMEIEEESVYEEDEFWEHPHPLHILQLTDDTICNSSHISKYLGFPLVPELERDPSVLRAAMIERDNFIRGRKGIITTGDDPMRDTSASKIRGSAEESKEEGIIIEVFDEDGNPIPLQFYGEPQLSTFPEEEEFGEEKSGADVEKTRAGVEKSGTDVEKSGADVEKPVADVKQSVADDKKSIADVEQSVADVPGYVEPPTPSEEEEERKEEEERGEETKALDIIVLYVNECYRMREERREDLQQTFDEVAKIVDRFKSANYDYGMVSGRQMSTTSAEFIVGQIERDILEFIDGQIAILPDPDLKKKKAKPEEVAMIREMVEEFVDENMHIFVPEIEELEEEEAPLPEVTCVYAVPGIGPPVDEEIIREFTEYAVGVSTSQAELFMPRNIRHFLCPGLEKYVEHDFEAHKNEDIPVGGGILTD